MSEADQVLFSEEQRKALKAVLDVLIPASDDGRVPSAGSVSGVIEFIENRAGGNDPAATVLLQGITAACDASLSRSMEQLDIQQRTRLIEQLESDDSEAFQALLRCTYMAYYSRADIRSALGLSAQPTQPDGYQVPVESPEEIARLTAAVRERGNCYRVCQAEDSL